MRGGLGLAGRRPETKVWRTNRKQGIDRGICFGSILLPVTVGDDGYVAGLV